MINKALKPMHFYLELTLTNQTISASIILVSPLVTLNHYLKRQTGYRPFGQLILQLTRQIV